MKKIPMPSREELVELYEVQQLSTAQISDLTGVSKSTVNKWLHLHTITPRKQKIEARPYNYDGINTGNPLESTTCPVSMQRLYEMYWKEAKSFRDIASEIAVITDERIAARSIRDWFKKCGFPSRNKSHSGKIFSKKNPGIWKKNLLKAVEASKEDCKLNPIRQQQCLDQVRKIQVKGTKANSKKCRALWVRVNCANPECKNSFTLTGRNKDSKYCSYSCANRVNNHNRKLKAIQTIHPMTEQEARRQLGLE